MRKPKDKPPTPQLKDGYFNGVYKWKCQSCGKWVKEPIKRKCNRCKGDSSSSETGAVETGLPDSTGVPDRSEEETKD